MKETIENKPAVEEDVEEVEKAEGSLDRQKQIDLLLKTDYFRSEKEAEEFLEQAVLGLKNMEDEEGIKNSFLDRLDILIEDAKLQVKEIQNMEGLPGKLVDEAGVFKTVLQGLAENFEFIDQSNKNPDKKSILENFKNFVRTHKKTSYAVIGLMYTLGANLGTADDAEASVPDDYYKAPALELDQVLEGLDLDQADNQEVESPEYANQMIEEYQDKIEEAKDMPDAMHFIESDEGSSNNIDVDKLVEKIKDGGLALHVVGLSSLNDSEELELSKVDLVSDYNQELVFYPVDSSEEKKVEGGEGRSFTGLGNTKEGAIAEAIENLAVFVGTDIETKRAGSQSQNENALVSSVELGIDNVVQINDIDIKEIDNEDIKENPWHKHFKYIVDVKY